MSRTGTKQAHLRDIFTPGKDLTITFPGKPDIEVYIRKPNPTQFEDANKKGRQAAARRRVEMRSKDSDEHKLIKLDISEMDLDELVKGVLGVKRRELERQSFNEVLFGQEHGSDWGETGEKYIDLMEAISKRTTELMELSGENLRSADFLKDEEYLRLDNLQKQFQQEVEARFHELEDEAELEAKTAHTRESLEEEYFRQQVQLEADAVWLMEYTMWRAFYAVRDPEDHKVMYFASPEEFRDMPALVQQQIVDCLENLESDPDPKSLIPPVS